MVGQLEEMEITQPNRRGRIEGEVDAKPVVDDVERRVPRFECVCTVWGWLKGSFGQDICLSPTLQILGHCTTRTSFCPKLRIKVWAENKWSGDFDSACLRLTKLVKTLATVLWSGVVCHLGILLANTKSANAFTPVSSEENLTPVYVLCFTAFENLTWVQQP